MDLFQGAGITVLFFFAGLGALVVVCLLAAGVYWTRQALTQLVEAHGKWEMEATRRAREEMREEVRAEEQLDILFRAEREARQ